jgi:hypothetical protein
MHKCTKIRTQISLTKTEVGASNPWKGVSRILSLLQSVLCAGCLRDCFVHFLFSRHLTFVISFLSKSEPVDLILFSSLWLPVVVRIMCPRNYYFGIVLLPAIIFIHVKMQTVTQYTDPYTLKMITSP